MAHFYLKQVNGVISPITKSDVERYEHRMLSNEVWCTERAPTLEEKQSLIQYGIDMRWNMVMVSLYPKDPTMKIFCLTKQKTELSDYYVNLVWTHGD